MKLLLMKCLILKVNGNLFFFSLKCFVPFPVKYKYWIRNVLFSLTKYFQSFLSDGEGRSYFIVQAWRLHITFIKKNFFFQRKTVPQQTAVCPMRGNGCTLCTPGRSRLIS